MGKYLSNFSFCKYNPCCKNKFGILFLFATLIANLSSNPTCAHSRITEISIVLNNSFSKTNFSTDSVNLFVVN